MICEKTAQFQYIFTFHAQQKNENGFVIFVPQTFFVVNRLLMSYFMDKGDVPKLLEVCEKYISFQTFF